MSAHIRFASEDEYEPSNSEDELDDNERRLIEKTQKRNVQSSESEDGVYGVESEESDMAESDVEGQEEDDLPNEKAWGRNKGQFYSTDYVDGDYGGFQGKDASLAEIEETEARNLQKQLIEQLDDDDFALDLLPKKPTAEEKQTEEVIKADVSKLTKREKSDLLLKESPEFFGLIADFKAKMAVITDWLNPLKREQIAACEAVDFVNLYHDAILNYATNIAMYLLLKANRVNIQTHPVVKRLYQFRQIFAQLDPIFEQIIQPQLAILTAQNKSTENVKQMPKKTLKLLKKLTRNTEDSAVKERNAEDESTKKIEKNSTKKVKVVSEETVEEASNAMEVNETNEDEEADNGNAIKRKITYQMAKNKGLTPHRKKEQRNPRVKHREKFRKAKIRRKGAVREVRKEATRYAGEMSGIKTSVVKGIKIKS